MYSITTLSSLREQWPRAMSREEVTHVPAGSAQLGFSERGLGRATTVFLYLFILPFGFDFRGRVGGSFPQYALAAISLVGFLGFAFAIKPRFRRRQGRALGVAVALWWSFLGSTLITLGISRPPTGNYVRVVFPFVLFGLGLLLVRMLLDKSRDIGVLWKPLLFASLVSVVWRFIFGLSHADVSLSQIRFQILSPAVPLFLGLGGLALFSKRRRSAIVVTGFVLSATSVALSVTRGYIFAIGAIVIAMLVTLGLPRVIRAFTLIGVLIILTFGGIAVLNPGLAARWNGRVFGGESLATYYTRVAQVTGTMHEVSGGLATSLIGKGLGAFYHWDAHYYSRVHRVMQEDTFFKKRFYPTEVLWTYPFFAGGALFGWQVPTVLLLALISAVRTVRQFIRRFGRHEALKSSVTAALFGYAGYLGMSFTADPLGSRFESLILGLLAGAALYPGSLLTHLRAPRLGEAGRGALTSRDAGHTTTAPAASRTEGP